MNGTNYKTLVIRLSSLGDVILATAALGGDLTKVDWAISSQFAAVLQGHPQIENLQVFDKKTGTLGWVRFSRHLWLEDYKVVIDLHRTLRTRLLKGLFFIWSLFGHRRFPVWKTISKGRFRLYGQFIFKALWPKAWSPVPWIDRYSQISGSRNRSMPDVRHLVLKNPSPGIRSVLEGSPYYCVMPSSRWQGKEWPVEHFLRVIRGTRLIPVILGTKSDLKSLALVEALKAEGLPFISGVGVWSIQENATVLSGATFFLGVDTGLGHLAQALQIPSLVLFGPTSSRTGFAAWGKGSLPIESPLLCRPCGKDGRFCYRVLEPYKCMNQIFPEQVLDQLKAIRGWS